MTATGKGLLAADESIGTIKKRFDLINVENTEENRRAYRELLLTTEGIEKFISGVIFYEEQVDQATKDGQNFVELLNKKGIVSGIKLDKGVVLLPGDEKNTATQGLTDLAKRAEKYYNKGCRFAKWRGVINVSSTNPSHLGVTQVAQGLARYGAICQANGLVPIIEPEIMVLVGDHCIERSLAVTNQVLNEVFYQLKNHHVHMDKMILKPNFVLPARNCPNRAECEKKIAAYTYKVLMDNVPASVPGIMFLSGGLSEKEAVNILNDLNKEAADHKPWALSYSYGRALQASTLEAWQGKAENVEAAQKAFVAQG
eukprot:CAMPEP_0117421676 /NCGR_PEP_ID=MMETSP0758-20121206/2698_1 /TAXON_ID=63605 /ORGANISM="Percolomonas cosmopolitus, Strain AE-1 (ATCC 50343)" /LENGTH=312 /DNA_ID=CAMNT_0005203899 /DNA_START=30 /DNA_END=964 /DNA_ORIENTATION=+